MQFVGINNLGFNVKFRKQFVLPFFTKCSWTDDDQSLSTFANGQFGPDKAGFDGLTKTDLIGNQKTFVERVKES